jgi:hypothetical protein
MASALVLIGGFPEVRVMSGVVTIDFRDSGTGHSFATGIFVV